ncbi:MAG: hypothetical protein M0O94_07065 [Bacteroidales bacterium]|nr:hypothetical protein [Bacteroidales bacterium]MDD2323203.1 hypothetical protein [Bacteroidales bacterium]MDD3961937.1 hypothetical protein [Bacteroidales bacterium]MDY0285440.1 hypothetical protein [Bacteroidales bacterium]
MKIAVDFDGTIVTHHYPRIGKPLPFAFETLRALQEKGHLLILWTYRSGVLLEEAIAYCKANGIEFYAINKSFPEEEFTETRSPKPDADLFIDDRNVGGLPSWGEIFRIICPEEDPEKTFYAKNRKWFRSSKR